MTLNLNEFDVLVFDIGKIKLAPQLLLATACFVDCKDCFRLSCHSLYRHMFCTLLYTRALLGYHTLRIAIITHITEGTVCPISFVKDVLVSRPVFLLVSLRNRSDFTSLTHVLPPSVPLTASGPGPPYGSHQSSSQPPLPDVLRPAAGLCTQIPGVHAAEPRSAKLRKSRARAAENSKPSTSFPAPSHSSPTLPVS